jgi:hypothetical protein
MWVVFHDEREKKRRRERSYAFGKQILSFTCTVEVVEGLTGQSGYTSKLEEKQKQNHSYLV